MNTDYGYEDSVVMNTRVYEPRVELCNTSSRHRHGARMTQIVPGFVLGNAKAMADPKMLQENHIDAIVSLLQRDSPHAKRFESRKSEIRDIIPEYRHGWVECRDSLTQDLLLHMSDICDFIDRMAFPELSLLLPISMPGKTWQVSEPSHVSTAAETPTPSASPTLAPKPTPAVLIRCAAGKSRSPTIVIAYLMRNYECPLSMPSNLLKASE
ncbi:dual specificity phosphatase Yvh1 [Penicillium herquei]|nr:dual specificity phosphatase Yvh1 [Penicillium herquei]